jgi:aryl-alcohol dehydrogenase-like predicted oxidoreductase
VEVLDTAIAYGESEAVLGRALRATGASFRIVTKVAPGTRAADVRPQLEASRARLGVERLGAVLLHDFASYASDPAIWDALLEERARGTVGRIGFSVYQPTQVAQLLERDVEFDQLQFPFSVFDRRMEPMLDVLVERGVEIHVRSIFLQGLLLQEPTALAAHFTRIRPKLEELRRIAHRVDLTLPGLLLAAVLAEPRIHVAVIGVDGASDLDENLAVLEAAPRVLTVLDELRAMAEDDEDLLLPMRWPRDGKPVPPQPPNDARREEDS